MSILTTKPKAFIGSSTEGKKKALEIIPVLKNAGIEPLPWFDFFNEDRPPLQELEKISLEIDCAVLVGTEDDQLILRDREWSQMRDNVLFEYGLFSGHIGRNKCALMLPDREEFRVPSDFFGLACFHLYRFNNFTEQSKIVAEQLASIVKLPCMPEEIVHKGRRLLSIMAWVREKVIRYIVDFRKRPSWERLIHQLKGIAEFIKEDIEALGITSEYQKLINAIEEASKRFPGFREPNYHRNDMEYALEDIRGAPPHREVMYYMHRYKCRFKEDMRYKCEQNVCFRSYWDEREYPYPYWEQGYHRKAKLHWAEWLFGRKTILLPCPFEAWTYGVGQSVTVFENFINNIQRQTENQISQIQEWLEHESTELNTLVTLIEKKLHEEIFGSL